MQPTHRSETLTSERSLFPAAGGGATRAPVFALELRGGIETMEAPTRKSKTKKSAHKLKVKNAKQKLRYQCSYELLRTASVVISQG